MPKNQIILLIAAASIYAILISSIGFLADDYDLLHRSANQHFLSPLESHHYSLLLNGLFRFRSEWIAQPQVFHLLALLFHFINILLVFLYTHQSIKLSKLIAFSIALLFAINLPGIEALTWCCSLPYVLTGTLILGSMIIYSNYLESANKRDTWLTSLKLSLLFLIGALIWEWIVLLIPILFVLSYLSDSVKTFKQKLLPILSVIGVFILAYYVKSSFDLEAGYEWNSPVQTLEILISSPFVGLFPFFPKSFYSSPGGIISEITLFMIFLWMARKSKKMQLFLAIFFICQLPGSLLGHPQSRYFYFSAFLLYAYLVVVISKFKKFQLLFSICYAVCLFLAISRIQSWQKASALFAEMKEELISLVERQQQPIVVLDLPKAYGPDQEIWRPHLWKGGMEIFDGNVYSKPQEGNRFKIYRFSWIDPEFSFAFEEVNE